MQKNYYSSSFVLGILGGGQLGKMLIQETARLDIRTAVLDPSSYSPCNGLANIFEIGDLKDRQAVYHFGKMCDLLTFEIEHVNVEALKQLREEGLRVYPQPELLEIVQHKGLQKDFYQENGIPTAPYFRYEKKEVLKSHSLNFPCVQKTATAGYDGKGVTILHSSRQLDQLPEGPGIIEAFAAPEKELSVIVSRTASGEIACYPPVEMVFHPKANLVELLLSPARIAMEVASKATQLARQVAEAYQLVGIMAVELFLTSDGKLWVNEVAPRPHNSGHHTIETGYTSQYEQHLRAILGLPLGSTHSHGAAAMVNILGTPGEVGPVKYEGIEEVMKIEGVYVHIYGKKQTRPFRKMGHVTVLADTPETALKKARLVQEKLKVSAWKNPS